MHINFFFLPIKLRKDIMTQNNNNENKHEKKFTGNITVEDIQRLENDICESQINYNSIVDLINEIKSQKKNKSKDILESLLAALFRIFGTLLREGRFSRKNLTENEITVQTWLKKIYEQFKKQLITLLSRTDESMVDIISLQIYIRLIRAEAKHLGPHKGEAYFPILTYRSLIEGILTTKGTDDVIVELTDKYLSVYHDLRYYFFTVFSKIDFGLDEEESNQKSETKYTNNELQEIFDKVYYILSYFKTIELNPEAINNPEYLWVKNPPFLKKYDERLMKKAFQTAWLHALSFPLKDEQHHKVLLIIHKRIMPYMVQPILLTDYITANVDNGGTSGVLAMNGLYELVRKYNLDYAGIYTKLYSLLDDSILQMEYRSRFFRILETMLSSPTLSSAIVASFIKRLARIALHAQPSAGVIIPPFIYNLMQLHPVVTVLIRRADSGDLLGYQDPFDNSEADPSKTNAISSSLWEISELQRHYYPKLADLSTMFSKPFNKPRYGMEDFLDHTQKELSSFEHGKRFKENGNGADLEYERWGSIIGESQTEGEEPYVKGYDW